jgi:hypothetical protein
MEQVTLFDGSPNPGTIGARSSLAHEYPIHA